MEAKDLRTPATPGTASNPGMASRSPDPAPLDQPVLPRPGTQEATFESDPTREAKHQGEQAAQAARREAGQVAQGAKETASHAMDRAREMKDRAASATRDQAHQAVAAARRQGTEMLRGQKDRAAAQIGDLGAAVQRAAEKLHEEQDDNLAGYADAMAGYLDRCASYLRERDVKSLVHDTADLARRRPEWVLGGAFVAGLALSRFLKASKRDGGPAYGAAQYRPPQPARGIYGADTASQTPVSLPTTPTTPVSAETSAFDSTLGGSGACNDPIGIETRAPGAPGSSPGGGGML